MTLSTYILHFDNSLSHMSPLKMSGQLQEHEVVFITPPFKQSLLQAMHIHMYTYIHMLQAKLMIIFL